MISNLKESWNTGLIQNELRPNNEEGCLFMINFSNSGSLLASTTGSLVFKSLKNLFLTNDRK